MALEDSESRVWTACSERADLAARCRVIPVLLRFYMDCLEQHRWFHPQIYGDNSSDFDVAVVGTINIDVAAVLHISGARE